MTPTYCDFCLEPGEGCTTFEAGNNAEVSINVELCASHWRELEALGSNFDTKYAQDLDRMASEVYCE